MSTKVALPSELRKLINSVASDCQEKLRELHGKYNFNDDHLESYMMNFNGKWTMDTIPVFEEFIARETKTSKSSKTVAAPQGDAGSKRKPAGVDSIRGRSGEQWFRIANSVSQTPTKGAGLPPDVLAMFGGKGRGDVDASTPYPKRLREVKDAANGNDGEEGACANGAPESPVKPLQVSRTSSVNDGNLDISEKTADAPVRWELLGDSRLWTGERSGSYSWMDETLKERTDARDARLVALEGHVAEAMCSRHAGEDILVGTVGVPSQSETVLCGRVACEGLEGRLNERSVLLEGSKASSNSVRAQLNVAECRSVAAFPGQIVSVLGRSGMSGTTFHARDFLAGLPPPSATTIDCSSPLHMLVIAGPYCMRAGLDYTPLEQLLRHAVQQKPQVLVILGPFLDARNQKVSTGDTALPGGDGEEPCSFEEVYTQHILPLLHRGLVPLKHASPATEIFVVPSLDDVLCFHPLPQPPLDSSLQGALEDGALNRLRALGVRFLPNPAHLLINGLKVSITSTDALSPILREIILRPEGKKIEEALRLLLYQRTLFPVVPRDPAQVCEARAAVLDFPPGTVPDVCVFPSQSGVASSTFVDNTVFVNPGASCRPAALGSFAELWLAPGRGAVAAAGGGAFLRECVRVDIQKLS